MAITEKIVKYDSSQATDSVDEKEGFRSYTIVYTILTDSTDDTAATVQWWPSAPQYGTVYSYKNVTDQAATLKSRETRQIGPTEFEMTCIWDTSPKSENLAMAKPSQKVTNPFSEPPKRYWRTMNESVYRFKDAQGKPFKNSTGAMFAEGIPTVEYYHYLRVERNEPYFDWRSMRAYVGAVNSTVFSGFSPGYVKCINIEAEEIYHEELRFFYCRVVYEMAARASYQQPWMPTKVYDKGNWCWVMKGGEKIKQYTVQDPATGAEISTEFFLDGSGFELSDAQKNSGNYYELDFYVGTSMDFNNLRLLTGSR